MNASDFLKIYSRDSFVQNLSNALNGEAHARIEGLTGSLAAIMASAIFENRPHYTLIILEDREEALYFFNDLQNIYGFDAAQIAYFPASFKREAGEVENANVIQRSSLLTRFQNPDPFIIVTYPEALAEKVVSKKTLVAHTLKIKVTDRLDLGFITELLVSYNFEKTDFVYEPGQFAIRGGILDVFSYSDDVPYRIELFDDEVESIRAFEAESQLSTQKTDYINITPNLQEKLAKEDRVPFFHFLPPDSLLVFHDLGFVLDRAEAHYGRVQKAYSESSNSDINMSLPPENTHLHAGELKAGILNYKTLELGKKSYFGNIPAFSFESRPQPSFHKDFNLLNNDLTENQARGYTVFIASDSLKQLNRLETIFAEINPRFKFTPLLANFREGFIDITNKLLVYTDHQIFERLNRYREKDRFSKSKALTLKELKALQPGDYVTHVDYGIGRFAGMETIDVGGKKQEAVRLVYRDNDLLYVNIHSLHKIAKYSGKEGEPPSMSKLGSPEWENRKSKVKRQVKDIAKELIALYAKRREAPGYAFSEDNYMQIELESSFMYEDTPDQATATAKVKSDMEKPYPMDRLVCGDVGFGKTEVAIRAAFKAAADGKQVAVLVPTTILALQHYKTFSERLARMPVNVDYLNRFKSAKETTRTLKEVADGKTDILIGTQKLLSKSLVFKDLGLLIIDEEQKFGVKAKDRIKELKLNVDVLTLTATPIPRTLHFSLMGARDLSVIATPPPNRQPVDTRVDTFKEELIRDALSYELARGGQVFFVHNRVSDIDTIANIIYRLVPEARIGVAHGQMEGDKLEKVMIRFIENEINVLISTNIIESGLDIPNANTMIINQAHMFGLSDLHQMRGRVGRSDKRAFCYLLTPPLSGLTTDARKRMQTIEQFSDLGDGFKVAMRDLDIRGAGNLLGSEQSGFINDLGYEMYHKILDEAVSELKETEFRSLFEEELSEKSFKMEDCQIETDLQILIPETYITNISERLSVYNTIDTLKTEEELESLRSSLTDRFGTLPEEVQELFKIVRIRWKAEFIGFEKLVLKNNKLKGYFVSEKHSEYYQADKFGKILDFIKLNPKQAALKQVKDKLTFEVPEVKSIEQIDALFNRVKAHIEAPQQ